MSELGWGPRAAWFRMSAPQHYIVDPSEKSKRSRVLLKDTPSSLAVSLFPHAQPSLASPVPSTHHTSRASVSPDGFRSSIKFYLLAAFLIGASHCGVGRTELCFALHLFILFKPPFHIVSRVQSHLSIWNCPSKASPLLASLWTLLMPPNHFHKDL